MHAKAAPQKGTDTKVGGEAKHIAKVQTSTGTPAANRSIKNRRVEPESRLKPAIAEREFGEGNYKAAKRYNQAAAQFAKSGKVAAAAAAAKPHNPGEAAAMERAEADGRRHGKGDDPAPAPAGSTAKIR